MLPAQARAARAMLQLKTTEVAAMAGVAPNTVTRVEQDSVAVRGPNASTVSTIRRFYEDRGIEFLDDDHPGLRLHGD